MKISSVIPDTNVSQFLTTSYDSSKAPPSAYFNVPTAQSPGGCVNVDDVEEFIGIVTSFMFNPLQVKGL